MTIDPDEMKAIDWLIEQWEEFCDRRTWEGRRMTTIMISSRLGELEKEYRNGGKEHSADVCFLMRRVLRGVPLPPRKRGS